MQRVCYKAARPLAIEEATMIVKPCNPYHARSAGTELLPMLDGRSVFKLYYIDIVGRENRARYEWAHSVLRKGELEAALAALPVEGVGFITAFPHITKVFRFAPSAETVLHVTAYNSPDLSALGLERDPGWVEFACYAEALIAADEYRAWADAESVDAYLEYRSSFDDGPVASSSKLREWWADR